MSTHELEDRRSRALAPAYKLFYDQPLHLVRGEGVWVYRQRGSSLSRLLQQCALCWPLPSPGC